jgi:excisionase family DNA binding protein
LTIAAFINAAQHKRSNVDTQLLTTSEAAVYLNTPAKTLITWRCTKRVNVPHVKIGGNVRYRKIDLDAFIEANTHGTIEGSK